jgi:hypothetical protein
MSLGLSEPIDSESVQSSGKHIPKISRWSLRFGIKALLALPVVAAVFLIGIDWFTTISLTSQDGASLMFHVVDAKTNLPIEGAVFSMIEGSRTMRLTTLDQGLITKNGGEMTAVGYHSLLVDKRRIDTGGLRLQVEAIDHKSIDDLASKFLSDAVFRKTKSGRSYVDIYIRMQPAPAVRIQ